MALAMNVIAVIAAIRDKRTVLDAVACGAFDFACRVVCLVYAAIARNKAADDVLFEADHEVLKQACRLLGNCAFGSTGRLASHQGASEVPVQCKEALVANFISSKMNGNTASESDELSIVDRIGLILIVPTVRSDVVLTRWLLHVLNECSYGGAPSDRQRMVRRCGFEPVSRLFAETTTAVLAMSADPAAAMAKHWTERGLVTRLTMLRVCSDTLHNMLFRNTLDVLTDLERSCIAQSVAPSLQMLNASLMDSMTSTEVCGSALPPVLFALTKSAKMLQKAIDGLTVAQ